MNYKEFYNTATDRLIETFLSVNFKGNNVTQSYLRNVVLKREPFFTEPVFQTMFPWKEANKSFGECTDLFESEFIAALAKEQYGDEDKENKDDLSFPKVRKPYAHQLESWKNIKAKKSIVVTSGTGSGKTECFTVPILHELYESRKASPQKSGVEAIFLYPLNALMDNQRERLLSWCKSLPEKSKVTFAVYNANTSNDLQSHIEKEYFPELRSRPQIRKTPPQILFTNGTMLEYMMVRGADKEILDKSKGQLKWIILDETHTYSGSAASELALLIRRVLKAFEVKIEDVNFAATSATVGKNEDDLKAFISSLTGKPQDEIVIVGGERIIPELDKQSLQEELNDINSSFNTTISTEKIHSIRKKLNDSPALSLTELKSELNISNRDTEEALDLINQLGEKNKSGQAPLPTRVHFYVRSIGGVYVCPNEACEKDKNNGRPEEGSFTTIESELCPCCENLLLELYSCSNCGKIQFPVLYDQEFDTYKKESSNFRISNTDIDGDSYWSMDDNIDDEDESNESKKSDEPADKIVISITKKRTPINSAEKTFVTLAHPNKIEIEKGEKWSYVEKEKENCCANCGDSSSKLSAINFTDAIMGQALASIILDNAPPMNHQDGKLYEGKKYIAFTDNRQGSAKKAFNYNKSVERNWLRSAVYYALIGKASSALSSTEQILLDILKTKEGQLNSDEQKELDFLNKKNNNTHIPHSWNDIRKELLNDNKLSDLYNRLGKAENKKEDYLESLFLNEFGKRALKGNSMESMGFIRIVYPDIEKQKAAPLFREKDYSDQDWRDLLKIGLDFMIRRNMHYITPEGAKFFVTSYLGGDPIYQGGLNTIKIKKWVQAKSNKENKLTESPNRIVCLLLASLKKRNINFPNERSKIAWLNAVLDNMWKIYVESKILNPGRESITENGKTYWGYHLDIFSQKLQFQINNEKVYICPVYKTIVDTTFDGISPLIFRYNNDANFDKFLVTEESLVFDHPSNKNINTAEYEKEHFKEAKKKGQWSNIQKTVFLNSDIFLTAEHTAQIKREEARKYEEMFKQGKLNILSCSTTMEMGIDISCISEVVMNNIPPKAANYLQRAGRAGRRGESKALSLVFCPDSIIGRNVFSHPKWPMEHETEMPAVRFESENMLQKHANALLLSHFLNSSEDIRLSAITNVGDFFKEEINLIFIDWLHEQKTKTSAPCFFDDFFNKTAYKEKSFDEIIENCIQQFSEIQNAIINTINELEKQGKETQGRANKKIAKDLDKIKNRKLFQALAEKGFYPAAGIPTGVIEFSYTTKDKYNKDVEETVQRHISLAISDYAPGTDIVINDWVYRSCGVKKQSTWAEGARSIFQLCDDCGYAFQTIGKLENSCPNCQKQTLRGVLGSNKNNKFTELIEPAGFRTENLKGKRTIKNQRKSYVEPELLNMLPWENSAELDESFSEREFTSMMNIRTGKKNAEILYYNKGLNGFGYAYCSVCGRMESETDGEKTQKNNPLLEHTNIIKAGNCYGCEEQGNLIRRHVLLAGRYQTDIAEIQLFNRDRTNIKTNTAYTLGLLFARKLAELIGVNDDEILFGAKNSYRSIFLFDKELGGSGYSILFPQYKTEILDLALKSLKNKKNEYISKYELLDKKTQWNEDKIDIEGAAKWLEDEKELQKDLPKAIKQHFPDARRITSSMSIETSVLLSSNNQASIALYLDENSENWHFGHWNIRESQLNRIENPKKQITFLLPRSVDVEKLSIENKHTLFYYSMRYNLKRLKTESDYLPLLTIKRSDGKSVNLFKGEECFFKTFDYFEFETEEIQLNFDSQNIFYFSDTRTEAKLSNFEEGIAKFAPEKWEKIYASLRNKEVNISYYDRYLAAESISPLIFLYYIKGLQKKSGMVIKNLSVILSEMFEKEKEKPENRKKQENFEKSINFLSNACSSLLKTGNNIDIKKEKFMQHARTLKIEFDGGTYYIKPDAGIAYTWIKNNKFKDYDTILESQTLLLEEIEDNPQFDLNLFCQNKFGNEFVVIYEPKKTLKK